MNAPALEVTGLRVGRGAFELGPLSFSLDAGAGLLVSGPAMAGKSTLLKALVGLLPAAGTLRLGALTLDLARPTGLDALRAQVGMVFQNDALFDSLSAAENVALPLIRRGLPRSQVDARVLRALAQVGLAEAASKRPDQLSGGMRKRLGLARALAPEGALLLVDDPLAGLDPGSASRIAALLTAAREAGRILIIACADPSPLEAVCAGRLALDAGHVAAGEPDDLRARA